MIRVLGDLPKSLSVACSGGTDSMTILDFLLNGRRKDITVLYFNHGTEHGQVAEDFVRSRCKELSIKCTVGHLDRVRLANESKEEYWRNQRYRFFREVEGPIVTSHHLDDCIETWIFNSLHGKPRTIPYRNGNVIRPFLLTKKSDIESWRSRRKVEVLKDPSNADTRYMRNYIRHQLVPGAMHVNPGLHKVIARIVQSNYDNSKCNNPCSC